MNSQKNNRHIMLSERVYKTGSFQSRNVKSLFLVRIAFFYIENTKINEINLSVWMITMTFNCTVVRVEVISISMWKEYTYNSVVVVSLMESFKLKAEFCVRKTVNDFFRIVLHCSLILYLREAWVHIHLFANYFLYLSSCLPYLHLRRDSHNRAK